MRFFANGPSIPDDLLIARDAGDVIFFCGAGVSRHRAGLPDFLKLGGDVIDLLGAGEESLARKLFRRIKELDPIDGVGGLIATDRIFSLLEREFEQRDVRNAVARAIKPPGDPDLSAHRTLIDLSRGRDGTVRLVTTNFDLLFEAAAPTIDCSGPPDLPNPRGAGFSGIVHLHGRVNAEYSGPGDEEFIVSSADFGRAYLSDGWATHFMQSLLTRFQIVFVGYGADDPPIQYLLEALNLHAGNRSRLFAFQPGSNTDDAALWEHRGVRAIPFDNSQGYDPLWDSLAAWAERARDVDGWYASLLESASTGPAALDPHVRGQIAHVLSTREGARRISTADTPLPASWLLALDPRQRFDKPAPIDPYGESSERIDPYESLSLDFDTPPQPIDEDDALQKRHVPEGSWSAFVPTRFDQEDGQEAGFGAFCGGQANLTGPLNTRLDHLGIWFHRVAHQPVALWWAAARGPLHPRIVAMIEAWLRQDPSRWPDDIRRGWRFLFESWSDSRVEPNQGYFELVSRVAREGWSEARVRDYAALFRPRLRVDRKFDVPHPLSWTDSSRPSPLVSYDVDYPHPYELLPIPDERLAYAVTRFRENLDLARSLEAEISGHDYVYMQTTRPDDGGPPIAHDSYGITGPIALFLQLMERLVDFAPERALSEIAQWPGDDHYIFGRLRIWAASNRIVPAAEAANILLGFPDNLFWGSEHQRDLLYAIRDRWPDFSAEDRARFEQRILTTAFPWAESTPAGKARVEAHRRLDRLHWLSRQGLVFSFDVEAEMAALRPIAETWSERSGEEAANSNAPVVRSIDTDANPRVLDHVPIGEILDRARQAGESDFFDNVGRRPFIGLAEEKPARALAALTDAARKGDVPLSFWSAFLHAEKRKSDPARLARTIGGRLASLQPAELSTVAYPVTEWLHGLGERLFVELATVLERLWAPLMAALPLRNDDRKHRVDSSWANDALNAPAGKLSSLLMQDPSTKGRELGQGFPEDWTRRQEQLLALPSDMRRHSLVMLGFQINWLFAIAPDWTTANLLTVVNDEGDDGDALWDGILWAARVPSRTLYERLKPGLLSRAMSPKRRRAEASVISGFLLSGWGGSLDADPPEQLVTSAEFREILVESDDDLRGQILWHLERWSTEPEAKWRARLVPFLTDVWPRHRAMRTPEMSARLVHLALASGDLFPQIVEVILPRLVPVRGGVLRGLQVHSGAENNLVTIYPAVMLNLLWAILAEDAMLWPYNTEEVLEALAEARETQADPRLSELRRRRAG
ncbi:SIR2 family protein [Pseudogemmobacter faecipullorum]|uniref:SIR2 family protein n=1 Tax=Pseudogemmobacter faecipullorum TaxID=2755041 RepID=A0ABS8CR52_9RHOB|nr:SIR2 family protein [Pseudogemmobacter faecipullorum]MCB5411867.1 SIR2 family protein [Pseudogemmobacter faecipullorum]